MYCFLNKLPCQCKFYLCPDDDNRVVLNKNGWPDEANTFINASYIQVYALLTIYCPLDCKVVLISSTTTHSKNFVFNCVCRVGMSHRKRILQVKVEFGYSVHYIDAK